MFRLIFMTFHGKPANEYPIGQFLQRIYIFEDVEKMGITGWIEMIDPYNLVRNGIILGQELLYLEFVTGGADGAGIEDDWKVSFTKKNPLYVHKIQDLKHQQTGEAETQGTLTYRLHFCSPELIQNDRTRVSRTLQGTYSDMIKNILKNDLKTMKSYVKVGKLYGVSDNSIRKWISKYKKYAAEAVNS